MNANVRELGAHALVSDAARAPVLARLVPLFAISGIAAIAYQLCWQRLLFVALGVDMDSVTIIVSTFMLGLGAGALAGGYVADRFPAHRLAIFACIELGIGAFGFVSVGLIRVVGATIVNSSVPVIAIANFLLLLFPTLLMGATLPVLVAHVVSTYRNVGSSIGLLYFVNTLGACLGAAATGFVVFHYFGVSTTISMAAALNVGVAAALWLSLRRPDA